MFLSICKFFFSFQSMCLCIRCGVEEVSAEDWTRVFDVNVRGYALTAKHIATKMFKEIMSTGRSW